MSSDGTDLCKRRVSYGSVAALACWIGACILLSFQCMERGGQVITTDTSRSALPPLFPITLRNAIGFACAIAGLIIAAGGGIGGGGLLIPIYILVMEIPIRYAIPLTAATVLGGSIANNILNVSKKHPEHPHRSCIDWDLILQLEPVIMLGALLGAMLSRTLPELVLVTLLLMLLLLTAFKTLSTAHKMHKKESLLLVETLRPGPEKQPFIPVVGMDTSSTAYGSVVGSRRFEPNGSSLQLESQNSFDEDKQHQVWLDIVKLTGLFAVVTSINRLTSGKTGRFGIQQCDAKCFWVSQTIIYAIIVTFAVCVRRNLLDRLESGGPIISDIEWDEENTVRYPIYAVLAGVVAGLFGNGGGIVKGPLILELGVHPAVASATTACMIMFTSSTATISYMTYGRLVYDYAFACFSLGIVATLVGQTVMSALLERYQRHSYIAYSIGIVVALSALCMAVECVITFRETLDNRD